jgi:CheY-like chemotaxis protein
VPATGLIVNVDPARMAQAIANLLTNAAKYSEPAGRIQVRATRDAGELVVAVRDSGIGIQREMLPHIFELFVQERQALDRSHGGLGLGLTIVRNIVTSHGGSVAAFSEGTGRGSEFVLRLPAAAVAASPAADEAALSPPVLASGGSRLLVVDDNEDAARMLAASLTLKGHEVRVAADGPAALALVQGYRPGVALLDIGLPAMDGYELASRLRAQPGLADLGLIAVTGYGQEADRGRATAAGFSSHLVKPVDIDELDTIVRSIAKGRA